MRRITCSLLLFLALVTSGSAQSADPIIHADDGILDAILEIDENSLVFTGSRPTVLVFADESGNCQPCTVHCLYLEIIAPEYSDRIDFIIADINTCTEWSNRLNITSIPMTAYFAPGSEPAGGVGKFPEDYFRETIEDYFGF